MKEARQSMHQTLEQARASAAWNLVSQAKKDLEKKFSEYVSDVRNLPAMINNNGLGQVVAFLFSKQKPDSVDGMVLNHLEMWLIRSDLHEGLDCYEPVYSKKFDKHALLNNIQQGDSATYIRATQEALAFLDYLRRFATGLSDDTENEGAEDE